MFKVIIVLISLFTVSAYAADSSKTPKEIDVDIKGAMPLPDLLDGDLLYNVMRFGWRHTQFMRFKLKKDEIVSWYSKERLSNGKVRVVHSYPVSGGYCRSYQSYIKIGNKEKHMTNIACKEDWMPGWRFYK